MTEEYRMEENQHPEENGHSLIINVSNLKLASQYMVTTLLDRLIRMWQDFSADFPNLQCVHILMKKKNNKPGTTFLQLYQPVSCARGYITASCTCPSPIILYK
eukprot:GFUD01098192.1.p1 GENE.GFUD01098192.1~~GFUD01098192.1.p1  ORF type:complete len:103 (+),score=10.67 GFUD01098192.1:1-309(+)